MAKLRLTAYSNGYTSTLFPVVGILYGASNGGKSTFAKLLMKLMTGKEVHPNQSDDFTATSIDRLKQVCEGVPIFIDDLARQQYQNHNEKVIKTDNWGIKERLINYPAIAISTNKLPSVTPDIYKRAITCRINVRISLTDGVTSSRKVNESIKNASTALYGEYVSRMLPIISRIKKGQKTLIFSENRQKSYMIFLLKQSETNYLPMSQNSLIMIISEQRRSVERQGIRSETLGKVNQQPSR